MISKVKSSFLLGIDAVPVDVEIDISTGFPSYTTVGLPDGALRESKDRVKSAIRNSGLKMPSENRIVINLAPASLRKNESAFDLPISVGLLLSSRQVESSKISDYLILGELSLDGKTKGIRGGLNYSLAAKRLGFKGVIIPKENELECSVVKGIDVIGVSSLLHAISFITSENGAEYVSPSVEYTAKDESKYSIDYSDVKGQMHVKRALEIAAAGSHNVLMVGPPGSGKTMMASRLVTILPQLTFEEAIETTRIYSTAGFLSKDKYIMYKRPFRAPHHTISEVGLVGGGNFPKPGEVSLAHNGVLFLDELPEFKRGALETLRQPLENRNMTITRSMMTLTFPAGFMLVCSMNPCPCGYLGDTKKKCVCSEREISNYRFKISGPLLDRIDIHVEAPSLNYNEIMAVSDGEESSVIRERVENGRRIQLKRFKDMGIHTNAEIPGKKLAEFCSLKGCEKKFLEDALNHYGFSARSYDRILKVARTIADLENKERVNVNHLAEAIQYRVLDKKKLSY